MWSKQAADVRNTNMTSLKSKITQRKRKSSKPSVAEESVDNTVTVENGANSNQTSKSKSKSKKNNKKNKGRSESGSGASTVAGSKTKESTTTTVRPDLLGDLGHRVNDAECSDSVNKDDVTHISNGKLTCTDHQLIVADVVLRNEQLENNQSVKRYSDSFVVFGDTEVKSDCNQLSRTQSGFFVIDTDNSDYSKIDKTEKKSRRFSDLFRYGTLKSYNSCDNLKTQINMIKEYETSKEEVFLREKPSSAINKQKEAQNKSSNKTQVRETSAKFKKPLPVQESTKNNKVKINKEPAVTQSSYLKRVKSKIYKQKNDANQILPTMPNISENVKEKKKKKSGKEALDVPDFGKTEIESRRSMPHFDFKMIRQTSNLERIRPRTFMGKKSASNAGISELVDVTTNIMNMPIEKPVLSKSKSSSSINLNVWKSRRNKLMEQIKKNCETVEDEFEFIAFGFGPMSRKFGSQNLQVPNGILKENDEQGNFS